MNGHARTKSSTLSFDDNVHLVDPEKQAFLTDVDSDCNDSSSFSHSPTSSTSSSLLLLSSSSSSSSTASSPSTTTNKIAEWANLGRQFATTSMRTIPQAPALPSHSHLRSLAVRIVLFLLPSFLHTSTTTATAATTTPHHPSPTAYLDGLRGVAAFIVFLCHYSYSSFAIAEGWGANDSNYFLFKLPFFRLIAAGPPMVALFFIISGYALSLKPLRLARARRWTELQQTLSSLAFRRPLRLYLPTTLSTLLIVVLLRLGAYEWMREWSHDRTYHWNVQETAPDRLPTLTAQLRDWAGHMFRFVHVWGWEKYGGSTTYDVHLWTIPVEFRASLVLFGTLAALARLRPAWRLLVLGGIMSFTYWSDRWEMVLFFVGMLYAELDLIRGAHTDAKTSAAVQIAEQQSVSSVLPVAATDSTDAMEEPKPSTILSYVGTGGTTTTTKNRYKASFVSRLAWAALATVSLYLLSQPDAASEVTPGWRTLASWIPAWVDDKYRYYQCIGASLFVFCAGRMPSIQRVLLTSPIQYLGRISYALYLMHGPVLHTVGYAMERAAWGVTGVETETRYHVGFFLATVGIVPAVVWAADVFWRAVDAPVVRFAKWVEGRVVVREETDEPCFRARRS